MVWQLIVIAMVGYLIGSINLSIILSKLMGKGDIREQGSGNAGTTNTFRVLGKGPAISVLLFDMLKAVIAILLGKWLISLGNIPEASQELARELAIMISAFAAILGHNYPIYYGFKGGKGIATSLGAILMIEWPIGVTCLIFGIVLILLSRMVSLGSIIAAILYPVLVLTIGSALPIYSGIPYLCFAILVCTLAIYRHKSNIERLLNGTENKLWKTKKEKAAEKLNLTKNTDNSSEQK